MSGEKIPFVEEKGTFGIDVEFLEPDFVWQGLNVQDVHGEELV